MNNSTCLKENRLISAEEATSGGMKKSRIYTRLSMDTESLKGFDKPLFTHFS